MNWKVLASVASTIATCLAALGAYITLGGPLVATRGYVDAQVHTLSLREAKIWRQAAGADLATWRIANPTPDQNASDNIKRLEKQIDDLDKRIEAME